MGRWTPLILMAGGLAILLGTLLGINFPMDERNAQAPTRGRQAEVLPANINVNSTATGKNSSNEESSAPSPQTAVSQNNNNTNRRVIQSVPTTTAQGNATQSDSTAQSPSNTSGNKAPIRALW